jgi:hypothetical protein
MNVASTGLFFFGHFAVRVRSPRQIEQPGAGAARTSTQASSGENLAAGALFSTRSSNVKGLCSRTLDFFYPPVSDKVRCTDGVERHLGEEQYLNRLQEFLATRFARSTAKELMRAELDYLAAFLRRLNDIASKGVHGPVTLAESKQGMVGLCFFQSNLCQHLSEDTDLAPQT